MGREFTEHGEAPAWVGESGARGAAICAGCLRHSSASGADLDDIMEAVPARRRQVWSCPIWRCCIFERATLPIIAAGHGKLSCGGLEMAFSCDLNHRLGVVQDRLGRVPLSGCTRWPVSFPTGSPRVACRRAGPRRWPFSGVALPRTLDR